MVYPISKIILWPFFKIFIKEIKGLNNLPKGKFILAANHASLVDGPILIFLTAKYCNKKLRLISIKRAYNNWFWNCVFNHFGAIRVNGSLDKAIKAIKQGDCIGLLPEGTRSYTGKIGKVKHSGLGVLALKTKLPVVPVAMKSFDFWNRLHKFPSFKRNIKINIGKPLKFKKKFTKANTKFVINKTMSEIKRLLRNA